MKSTLQAHFDALDAIPTATRDWAEGQAKLSLENIDDLVEVGYVSQVIQMMVWQAKNFPVPGFWFD